MIRERGQLKQLLSVFDAKSGQMPSLSESEKCGMMNIQTKKEEHKMVNQLISEISNKLSGAEVTLDATKLLLMTGIWAAVCVLGSVTISIIYSVKRKKLRKVYQERIAVVKAENIELSTETQEEEQSKTEASEEKEEKEV